MYSLLLRLKRRIKRLLKVQTESREHQRPVITSRTFKFTMLVLASLATGLLYPGQTLYDPFDYPRTGEIAREDVLAPFQIPLEKKDRELREEMEDTKLAIPIVVDYDTTIYRNAFAGMDQFFGLVDSLRKSPGYDQLRETNEAAAIVNQRFPLLSEAAIRKSLDTRDLDTVYYRLRNILQTSIYQWGVLPDASPLPESRNKNVLMRIGDRQNITSRDSLLSNAAAGSRLLAELGKLNAREPIDEDHYYQLGKAFIHPNLRVNRAEYNRRVDEAVASISTILEVVEQGDIIVRQGRKVTERQERLLHEMNRMKRMQESDRSWLSFYLPVLARVLLSFVVYLALYLFLFYFRPDIYRSNPRLLAIFFVFALQLFLTYLIGVRWEQSIYLYPVALLPILVTILFDAEIGILATVILAGILGIMHRFDFTLTLMTLVVGPVACFTSWHVRKRSEFFRIMYSTTIMYAAFILLVETLKLTPSADVLTEVTFGMVNGIVTSLLAVGILPFFESLFGITTDITLLELSDPNHPLLKRLALEAPGTYHHSIIVANLNEAAAKAIGANPLLARVGAYFHDIGKIEIPEYFVENQLSVKSKHDELTPSMSAIILSSHVKMGRRLGEEADIPDDVLNFIEEHHGTMVQSYFYNKALEQGSDESAIEKYRYPGPRPQTRETGIAMLADAVEAASRTLDDPKPARINNLIQRIINDRFQSGELDQCPLTLRDLAKIKEAFSQVLIGAFHHRVAYPKKDKSEEE